MSSLENSFVRVYLDLSPVEAHDSSQLRHSGEAGRQGACNTEAALTTTNRKVLFIMADQQVIAIPLHLPRCQATALAQFCKRIDRGTVGRFAAMFAGYDSGTEGDVMWLALVT